MSLAVKHVNVPEGFNFSIRMSIMAGMLSLINKYYRPSHVNQINNEIFATPRTGTYTWDSIDCFVYNQEKSGYMELYFNDIEHYNLFSEILISKEKKKVEQIKNKLYRWNPHQGWTLAETYSSFDEKYLIGYKDYFKSIEKDIDSHKKNTRLLKLIGEYKSLTYLLYGVPGTGKTTLIKALSSKYNMDVYVVNSIHAKSSNLGQMLNPGKGKDKNVILLFEDFDRFIEKEENKELMGIILNALDGFDDTDNTIRFFTGNNCEVIFNEQALINRVSGKYKFGYPDREMFRDKLLKLLIISKFNENSDLNVENIYTELMQKDIEKIERFLDLIVDKNITLRPFTSYCIRYLFNKNCLDDMIENIQDLIGSV
jgi:predicted AAA+ superfamily ATPase